MQDRRSRRGARAAAATRPSAGASGRGLQFALWGGAATSLLLLVVGFFAPGGWTRGMAGRTAAIHLCLLAVLAVCVSTFRGEPLKWIADGPPLAVVAACFAAVLSTHPDRAVLLRW